MGLETSIGDFPIELYLQKAAPTPHTLDVHYMTIGSNVLLLALKPQFPKPKPLYGQSNLKPPVPSLYGVRISSST